MIILIITCVASFPIFKYYYGRLVKYFLINVNNNSNGIIASMIDRGIVCFLYGMTHRLLLGFPNAQLFTLIVIESLWIASRIFFTRNKTY